MCINIFVYIYAPKIIWSISRQRVNVRGKSLCFVLLLLCCGSDRKHCPNIFENIAELTARDWI